MTTFREAVCAAIVQGGKVLLLKKANSEAWVLPGAKPENGEDDETTLKRKIKNELPQLELLELRPFIKVEGKTPYVGDVMVYRTYLGVATGDITPGTEHIARAEWSDQPEDVLHSEGAKEIIRRLRQIEKI